MAGRFIVFEGIDGSGKSTTMQRVAKALGRDHVLVTTCEETDTPLGEMVRASIRDKMDPLTTTFLFLADRNQHAREIRSHLEAGRHVLCDRFSASTYAYQGTTLQGRIPDPDGFLDRLHEPIGLEPDHTLLFRGDPETCVRRARGRGETTPYEKVEFLARVQERYLELACKDGRFTTIDAEAPLEEVVRQATELVQGWLAGQVAERP